MTTFADEVVGKKAAVRGVAKGDAGRGEPVYVQWEPGVSGESVLPVEGFAARVVEKVPEVADVKGGGADAWFARPTVENLMAVRDRAAGDVVTRVAILRDATHLFVAFECMESDFSRLHRLIPRDAKKGELKVYPNLMARVLDHDDHVGVRIDPQHDHTNSYWMRVNVNGARRAEKLKTYMSWAAVPVCDGEGAEEAKWESEVVELKDRWRCAMKIEMASIGVGGRPVVGVQLSRARYGDCLRHYVSASTLQVEFGATILFNDLYLQDSGVTVREVRWEGERKFGENELVVAVANRGAGRKLRLVGTVDGVETVKFEGAASEVAAGGQGEVRLKYDWSERWEIASLVLDLQEADTGKSVWRASYPLANHSQLNVVRLAPEGAAENPKPSDPDFREKKIAYVQSRLPKFVRRNTSQGAVSDFVLEAVDGSVSFNLMEAGVLAKIGKWVDSLFDNAIDRIVAAALFSNDNAVTTHCAARVSLHSHMTALSALRLGAGHCYSRALGGTGIVNAMTDPRTGKPFEAYPCLVVGHVVTAIRWRDGWTFIDPSFGNFFFNKDNTDLATDLELEADHALIERVAVRKGAIANYGRRDVQVRLEEGTVVWPAGAPAR